MTDNKALVPVIQDDRDAAAYFHALIFDTVCAQETRDGKDDCDELVQAFARHRLSALAALGEAIEAIDGLSDAVGRYFEVGPLSAVRRDLRQALERARTVADKLRRGE